MTRHLLRLTAAISTLIATVAFLAGLAAPAGAITAYNSEQSWNVCLSGGPCRWFTLTATGNSSTASTETPDQDPSYTCGGCFVHVAATEGPPQHFVDAARKYGVTYVEVFARYGESFEAGPNVHDIKVHYSTQCYAMSVRVTQGTYGVVIARGAVAHVVC